MIDEKVELEDWEEEAGPEEETIIEYPLVPLRDTVIFPHMVIPLFVARARSVRAVEAAVENESTLIVVTQRDAEVENPSFEDVFNYGTEVSIGRMLHMPDGTLSVLCQGQGRVELLGFVQIEPYIVVRVKHVPESKDIALSTRALMRAVLALFEKTVQLNRSLPEDAYVAAMNVTEPGWLADLIIGLVEVDVAERQEILELVDPSARLERLSIFLARELDVLELESKIHTQVQEGVDKSQREYFLREQLRVIQRELGELDSQAQGLAELRGKIAAAQMPQEVQQKAERELQRLQEMPPHAPEVGVIRTYLDWLIELPWAEATEDNLDVTRVAEVLEKHHYGLAKAKERILEHIAVKKLAPDKMRSPILCFVGPPGTGKTSLGRSIAEALNRKFVRVSLGGIRDEAEIRGHRRTYVGALPGRIIQTMRRAKTINPVFMLDEIDKIGIDFRGDPAAALLEVLDPEQNHAFSDHYLDVAYDLSRAMFITTANVLDTIPHTLQDRMEVIQFPGYTEEEKLQIAKRFIIPRLLEEHGLVGGLRFSQQALVRITREYTSEAGVRNLERELANICRKVARLIAEDKPTPQSVTQVSLPKYLGPPRFSYGAMEEEDEVGVATGVAWTEAGGDLLSVEVTVMEGKGNLLLTGQLGEIMQESAQAALSYARSHAQALGIRGREFDKIDIHVHVPEGAIPKDGPSGGVTIATALISALSGRPVRREVGMTGEITLRGRVLPVGGLKEKVLAAHRAGLKTFVLPERNRKDLVDIPRRVQRELGLTFVERMEELLAKALAEPGPEPA